MAHFAEILGAILVCLLDKKKFRKFKKKEKATKVALNISRQYLNEVGSLKS